MCFLDTLFTLLFSEEIRNEEPDIGRAFRQTAHEVGVPVRAKWNVDADGITFLDQLFLQIAADTVQHLKLDGLLGQAYFFRILLRKGNPFLVMGRDRRDRWYASVGAEPVILHLEVAVDQNLG